MDRYKQLKDDEYYLFYEMMMQALRTDDVINGINKSLFLLKVCLSSGHIVLHKKDEEGRYTHSITDATMKQDASAISCIVNKTAPITERKRELSIDLSLSKEFKNIKLLYFKTKNNEYILSINNLDPDKNVDLDFFDKLRDTLLIILKRAESYERNVKAMSTDLLTGLENRNSYETRLQTINESDDNIVFGIFDLFRLKHINDNYSHPTGDLYIKEAAKILNKYWPKTKKQIVGDAEVEIETGHNLYRVGGDEFVLITTKEPIELTKIKSQLAAEEVSMINLGIVGPEPVQIGLNVGVVEHTPGDYIKNTFKAADKEMQSDKKAMYKTYGLERRQ